MVLLFLHVFYLGSLWGDILFCFGGFFVCFGFFGFWLLFVGGFFAKEV